MLVLTGGTQTGFTSVDCTKAIPAISRIGYFQPNGSNNSAYIRVGGSSATNGWYVNAGGSQDLLLIRIPVSSTQTIEYKQSGAGSGLVIYVSGYELNIR